MPKYRQKITELMEYADFKEKIQDLVPEKQALLTILFLAGCRISEALALTSDKVRCSRHTVFIEFHRLKGSKQTDPQELPRVDALEWLCGKQGKLFKFSYITAYRTVRQIFPKLYPHYFRMNRITKTDIEFGDAVCYHIFGISATSIDHYRGKVDIKAVGKSLREEVRLSKDL